VECARFIERACQLSTGRHIHLGILEFGLAISASRLTNKKVINILVGNVYNDMIQI
jgi:hypothetical protein